MALACLAEPAPSAELIGRTSDRCPTIRHREPPRHQVDALVAAAQGGDPAAFAALYAAHRPTVHGYVARRLPNDPEAVEDVVADVFCAAWRWLGGYTNGGPWGAWLLGIARRAVLAHLERQRRAPLLLDDLDDAHGEEHDPLATSLLERLADSRADTAELAITRVMLAEACAAIRTLAPSHRRVLFLRFARDMDFSEIAAATGVTEKAAGSTLDRARQRLRERLGWAAEFETRASRRGLTMTPREHRAYLGQLAHFRAWCDARGVEALPATAGTVVSYLRDLVDQGRPLGTLAWRIAYIGAAHKTAGYPSPCADPAIRVLMRERRRAEYEARQRRAAA